MTLDDLEFNEADLVALVEIARAAALWAQARKDAPSQRRPVDVERRGLLADRLVLAVERAGL